MSDITTHLLLPYILASQAQKHVTHNEALRLPGIYSLPAMRSAFPSTASTVCVT
jgi:hypothetical protein